MNFGGPMFEPDVVGGRGRGISMTSASRVVDYGSQDLFYSARLPAS